MYAVPTPENALFFYHKDIGIVSKTKYCLSIDLGESIADAPQKVAMFFAGSKTAVNFTTADGVIIRRYYCRQDIDDSTFLRGFKFAKIVNGEEVDKKVGPFLIQVLVQPRDKTQEELNKSRTKGFRAAKKKKRCNETLEELHNENNNDDYNSLPLTNLENLAGRLELSPEKVKLNSDLQVMGSVIAERGLECRCDMREKKSISKVRAPSCLVVPSLMMSFAAS